MITIRLWMPQDAGAVIDRSMCDALKEFTAAMIPLLCPHLHATPIRFEVRQSWNWGYPAHVEPAGYETDDDRIRVAILLAAFSFAGIRWTTVGSPGPLQDLCRAQAAKDQFHSEQVSEVLGVTAALQDAYPVFRRGAPFSLLN